MFIFACKICNKKKANESFYIRMPRMLRKHTVSEVLSLKKR
jgi:hypothetical protein